MKKSLKNLPAVIFEQNLQKNELFSCNRRKIFHNVIGRDNSTIFFAVFR
jgi:hypothetical protein